MVYESYTATNVGRVRNNNEDNFYVNGIYKTDTEQLNKAVQNTNSDKSNLYAVCDGMGGEEFGEKASLIGVSTLAEYQGKNFNDLLNDYVKKANKKICDLINENNGMRSGTTFAALNIENDTAIAYNVGDSRVYMLRQGQLKQLSVDHTRIQQMLNMGLITPEKAKIHKDRHVLTQHFGIFPDEMILSPHVSQKITLQHDDMFLLCSDGLTDMLSNEHIKQIMLEQKDVKKCVESLIDNALANGGKDNVTVQIVRCVAQEAGNGLLSADSRTKESIMQKRIGWLLLLILGISLFLACVAIGSKLPALDKKDEQKDEMIHGEEDPEEKGLKEEGLEEESLEENPQNTDAKEEETGIE